MNINAPSYLNEPPRPRRRHAVVGMELALRRGLVIPNRFAAQNDVAKSSLESSRTLETVSSDSSITSDDGPVEARDEKSCGVDSKYEYRTPSLDTTEVEQDTESDDDDHESYVDDDDVFFEARERFRSMTMEELRQECAAHGYSSNGQSKNAIVAFLMDLMKKQWGQDYLSTLNSNEIDSEGRNLDVEMWGCNLNKSMLIFAEMGKKFTLLASRHGLPTVKFPGSESETEDEEMEESECM